MVGPSLSEADRDLGMSRLQAFVVGLVAASGALVALYADASFAVVAGATVGGGLVGLGLWYYLVWTFHNSTSRRGERDRSESDDFEKRERFD
ncbi:hypothetical protein G9C85_03640 [Halorubellus sp. JP-L1]|uniref:hypothetical protein n=1 Tax=Halorubellus sp. JP-L1 TaxID=2715753 RepID=UPI001409188A|nr:hypothetical protein [Halorubellus sp. JP-L1]NHN40729.1 hypothetical protein [Halorubellus sp. JP-L1]